MAAHQILAVKLYLLSQVEQLFLQNRLLFWNKIKWNHEWLNDYIYKSITSGTADD
jgi:hypothetical protein